MCVRCGGRIADYGGGGKDNKMDSRMFDVVIAADQKMVVLLL